MIRLSTDSVRLEAERAQADLSVRTWSRRHDRIVVDIYSLNGSRHPAEHLGWWLFHLARRLEGTLLFDFSQIGPGSVTLRLGKDLVRAADCWYNPDYTFSPVQDLHLVLRDRENQAISQQTYQLINDRPGVLKRFYDRLHATDGYKTEGNTFLNTLHHYKLGLLNKIFQSYIPEQGRVLDVGCGNSLFTEIAPEWNFKLYCCDLGEPVIRQRLACCPQYSWLVSNVVDLPYKTGSFEAVFAGEIIEHMPSVEQTLSEWNRILVPGGIMVLTTPNRQRLRNRINRSRRPLGEDHLNELGFNEAKTEIERAGFVLIGWQSFYLELFLNWWSPRHKFDYLQSSGNKPINIKWMNLLNRLGEYFPAYAFGLIFIARKRSG
ncbi:class I SAM-dependent methyltransferase [bacterium]|nr:class I SAM-dependent methyltransferase [bacterium]